MRRIASDFYTGGYKMILQMDKDLSLEEMGVFATMVNLPEADYTTEDYLAEQSSDKAEYIETLLCSLLEKGYVLKIGEKYAVNKEMIPQVVKEV